MSNISSARGLSVPTFQPAQQKGDGTAGNGAGGMFFAQEEQSEETPMINPFDFHPRFGLEDVPYILPLLKKPSDKLRTWKKALATAYYRQYASNPILVPLPDEPVMN